MNRRFPSEWGKAEKGKILIGFSLFLLEFTLAMVLLTDIAFWLSNVLIALLLIQAFRGKFFAKYVLFFSYLSYVLVVHVVTVYVYSFRPEAYLAFYWYTYFFGAALGYCVIWEIYTHVLRDFPGTARMARCLVGVFLIGVLGAALVNAFNGEASGLVKSVIRFERNLQAVQAILLTLLLILIRYYAIPLGRNLRGLIVGYGFLIGVSVVTLTLRSQFGVAFQLWWQYLQQSSGLITSVIWVPAFWVYVPNPKPDVSIGLDEDYAALTERSYRAIAKARAAILRVF
ncbi:MAG: hypothetical protein A3H27_03895 [Acidobacteria bacterium RIFCSPLOWO2_02_FULL_59_13]|nr:MAG: hypothetical protein A3H27_03895 [Acidobacteria bacterium RIFCSPLOWO2_02_FULL_59_13]OFW44610.1 MAG: hypothetical protein A3J28_08000 [Acidobacteria bacterium RIFCSPLOWO2_12_FULL_60_22]